MIAIGLCTAFSMALVKPGYHDGSSFCIMMFGVLLTVIDIAKQLGFWSW